MLGQNYVSELLKCAFRDTLEITKSFNFEINILSRFKIQNFLKGIQWKKHLDRTTQDKFPRGKEVYQFPYVTFKSYFTHIQVHDSLCSPCFTSKVFFTISKNTTRLITKESSFLEIMTFTEKNTKGKASLLNRP